MTIDLVVRDDDHEPTLLFNPAAWVKDAACRGLEAELFFPSIGVPVTTARQTCWECPVQTECLIFALNNVEKFGIWGGTSENERRELRRLVRLSDERDAA